MQVRTNSELQAAARSAKPGDVAEIADGTYEPFEITVSGQPGKPITFKAANKWGARIDGKNRSPRGIVMAKGESHLVIENLRVENGSTDGIYIEGTEGYAEDIKLLGNKVYHTGNAGIYVCGIVMGRTPPVNTYYLKNVLIEGNDVSRTNESNGGNECISVGGGVEYVTTQKNKVYDSEQYGIDYKLGVRFGQILNNEIRNMEKHAIYIDAAARACEDIIVAGNKSTGCNNGIVLAREAARESGFQNLRRLWIFDNDMTDNRRYGLLAYKHARDNEQADFRDIYVYRNTFEGGSKEDIAIRNIGPVLRNMLLSENEAPDVLNNSGARNVPISQIPALPEWANADPKPEPTPEPIPDLEPRVASLEQDQEALWAAIAKMKEGLEAASK